MSDIIRQREHKDKRAARRVGTAVSLVLQLGITMLTAIGLCCALGLWIDRRCGTRFWMIVLFFVGALGGASGCYRLIRRFMSDDE